MESRRVSAEASIVASAASTWRRTRPQKSISHVESKPVWNRLKAPKWVLRGPPLDLDVALVGNATLRAAQAVRARRRGSWPLLDPLLPPSSPIDATIGDLLPGVGCVALRIRDIRLPRSPRAPAGFPASGSWPGAHPGWTRRLAPPTPVRIGSPKAFHQAASTGSGTTSAGRRRRRLRPTGEPGCRGQRGEAPRSWDQACNPANEAAANQGNQAELHCDHTFGRGWQIGRP